MYVCIYILFHIFFHYSFLKDIQYRSLSDLLHLVKSSSMIIFSSIHVAASLVAQVVKHLPIMQETRVQSLGREDPLEKEMATHSSILAWKIPWTEEPGRLVHGVTKSRTRLSNFTFTLMLLQMALSHSFYDLVIGTSYICTTSSLSIHLLMGI